MNDDTNPLPSLDAWEDDLLRRYPQPSAPQPSAPVADQVMLSDEASKLQAARPQETFRDYRAEARACVKEFYRLNHQHQTFAFGQQKRAEYLPLAKREMGIWEAMEYLNELVDDSDPDIDLPQIEHLLQTGEAIRQDGRPRWFIAAGVIHDLGKILCLWGEPQWAVVGDTFPVGCRFSEKIVFPEFFVENPDSQDPQYQTELGLYERHCGLDHVYMSWGHDEYLYHVVKDYLPTPALYMIRYHSFYPAHREHEYDYLMNDQDRENFPWVRDFNKYDLYTKRDERMDVAALRPFYEELFAEFFPAKIRW